MKKKIISTLLAAALCASFAVIPAQTASASAKSDSILSALGIVDEDILKSVDSSAPLTRADAAYYVLRVSGNGDIPEYTADIFSDVTADTENAAAINYCASLGIVAAGAQFRPNDPVKVCELFKMIESALGYDEVAAMLGGWTGGYMKLASSLAINDGLAGVNENSAVTYGQLECILYNTLMSPGLEIENISSESSYKLNNKENVLYKVFDVYKAYGTVVANAVTTLTAPVGVGTNSVKIGDTVYKAEASVYPGLARLLGYEVDAWVRTEDSQSDARIIAYELKNTNDTEIIDAEDFVGISNGVLTYKKNSRKKALTLPADCTVIYNGKAVESEVNSDVFNNRWGSATLIRKGTSKIQTVIITAYDNYYVGNIDKLNFSVYDNTANNRKLSFKDGSDLSEFAYFRDNAGNVLTFADITTGSVLSVAQNGNCYDTIIVKESVTGVLEQVSYDSNDRPEASVDNNTYKLSPEMDNSRVMQLKIGSSYKFYLDGDGRIAAAVLVNSDSQNMSWVYVLRVFEDEIEDRAAVRFLSASDEKQSLLVAERVKIDGALYKDIETDKLEELLRTANSERSVQQPVKLRVNDDGEISDIDTTYHNSAAELKSDSARRFYNDESETLYFKGNINSFGMQVRYNGETVVFCIPSGSTSDDYSALDSSAFITDTAYNIAAYNSDTTSRTAEVIVCTNAMAAAKQMWMQDSLTVVTSVNTELDPDNDVVTVLRGYQNGTLKEWVLDEDYAAYVDPSSHLSGPAGSVKIGKGDVVRFSTEKTGKINQIQQIYDCSERKYYQPTAISGDSKDGISAIGASYQRMQIGLVIPFRYSDGALVSAVDMSKKADDDNQKYIVNSANSFKVYIVDAASDSPSVKLGSIEDVKDWYNYAEEEDTDVLMRCRYDEGRDIVIYNY